MPTKLLQSHSSLSSLLTTATEEEAPEEEQQLQQDMPCSETNGLPHEPCWVTDSIPSHMRDKSKNISRGSLETSSPPCPRKRVMDDEGYIRRAACVCVNDSETQVVLVSGKKDPGTWLVPGGGLEVGEEATTAAIREAWEEAGIQGHIQRYLGLFESCCHVKKKKHRTAVYIVVVDAEHQEFPEAKLGRCRRWFSLEDGLLHLSNYRPMQSAYLRLMMMSRIKAAAAS